MVFDPDKFLAKKPAPKTVSGEFDPDQYLARPPQAPEQRVSERDRIAQESLPEDLTIGVPGVPELQTQVDAPPWLAKGFVDVGRGGISTAQGVKQLSMLSNVKRLKKIADGERFYDTQAQIMRKPTELEQGRAVEQYQTANKNYQEWLTDKSDELAMYRASTKGRETSAFVGEMLGATASLPIPGVGPARGAGMPLWQAAKRVTTEGAIGAGSAGLDFVPDGLSREDNILFGLLAAGVLKGTTEGGQAIFKRYRGKPSKEEAEEILAQIRAEDANIDEAADVYTDLVDEDFINKQLEGIPPGEIEGLNQAQKERVAIFQFMDAQPTRGQVLRDPIMMSEEIKLSTTDQGKNLRIRMEDQAKAAKNKLREITGKDAKDRFGVDLKNTMTEIKDGWLEDNEFLYKEAARRSDPTKRFDPNIFTSTIFENQEKINASRNLTASLKEINRNIEKNLALPEQLKEINKQMKAEYGDNAAGLAFKLTELMKLTNGLSAAEGNDTVMRILNSYDKGQLNPVEVDVITSLREGVLDDTVAGIGGDYFLAARNNFKEMQDLIEQFPIMENFGFYKQGRVEKKPWSEEEVFKNIVFNANNDDFYKFMELMDAPKYKERFAPIKESLRDNVFSFIKEEAVSGKLGRDHRPTFRLDRYEKALDKLTKKGGMRRLGKMLSQEEIRALGMIKRYGQTLAEPEGRRTVLNPSNTAIQGLAGAVGILNRTPEGKALLFTMGEASKTIAQLMDNEEARRLAGNKVGMGIKQLEKIATQTPGSRLPSLSPAASRGANVATDKEEQERQALGRMLAL